MTETLQQKKEELAGEYLAEFKKELWFFKWSIISIFAGRLKKMMASDESLGDDITGVKLNFLEKMLVNISPTTAERVFLFVKEKQEKLQTAKTVQELEMLKSWILPPFPSSTSEVDNGTWTSDLDQSGDAADGWEISEEEKVEAEKIQEAEKKYADEAQQEKDQQGKDKTNNIIAGVWVGWWFWLTVWSIDKIYKLQDSKMISNNIDLKTPEQFANKMRGQFEDLSKQLAKEAQLNPKLNKFQSQAMSKSAKEFEKIAKEVDKGTLEAVDMLGKLERKLPASLLKSIDPKDAEMLIKLGSEELDEIITINKLTTITENAKNLQIEEILKAKGIKGMNKEVINTLKLADDVAELKGMVKVLTKLKWIKGFMKWIKWIALLDLMSTWFDVRILLEGLDDAELYRKANAMRADTKREHQWVQFGASVAITALGIIGTCAAVWSSVFPGLWTIVWLAAWGLWFVMYQAIDIYYNKVEFFMQNEADFKKQYRTEIKQAIVQSAWAEAFEMNESTRKKAAREKGAEITTAKDAWKVLIRQEEYEKQEYSMIQQLYYSDLTEEEFLKTLTAEEAKTYQEQKTAINKVIDIRFSYIQRYTDPKTKEYQEFTTAMTSSMGIKKVEKIIADSKTYYDMQQTGPDQYIAWCTDIHDYKKKFWEKLQSEDTKLFAIGEKMWKENPYKFIEIYHGVKSYENIFDNQKEQETDQTMIDTIQKNIDFIKRFHAYKTMGLPIEEEQRLSISIREVDNKKIEEMLISSNFDIVNSYTPDNVKWYLTNNGITDRMETKIEVADSVGQNIIYRIATEIHGYSWANDMTSLIQFFSMGKENATGLYYDDKWIINNDRAVDKSIDISEFDTMSAEDIMKKITKPNRKNRILAAAVPSPLGPVGVILWATGVYNIYGFTDDASSIDTDTESMDDDLNAEYMTRLKNIVYQEKALALPETKKLVEQKIVEYITTNVKDEGYIELPYYLIIAAKKSGIGDLQKCLFTKKNNQIVACTNKLYITEKLDFGQTDTKIIREYVSWAIETIWANAQKYIDYVDAAKNQFESLITYEGNELEIPKEYLEMHKAKIVERDTIKQSLLAMDPSFAASQLEAKYEEYHDYFENNYIATLSVISKFGKTGLSSNDVDSVTHQQQIAFMAARLSSASSWPEGAAELLKELTEKQKSIFDAEVQKSPLKEKQIIQNISSPDPEKKKKAIWEMKQVIKSILEMELITYGKQGDIEGISHGEGILLINSDKYKEKLKTLLAKNLAANMYFDDSLFPIDKPVYDNSAIEIKTLTQWQESLTAQTKKIQKAIEATEPDIVYPGRGLVTFDPDTSKMTSYWKSTKIEITSEKTVEIDVLWAWRENMWLMGGEQKKEKHTFTYVKVEWLDIVMSLQEWIYAANLLNWIQGKYLKNNPDFAWKFKFGNTRGPVLYAEDGMNDVDVLSSSATKKNYSWLSDTDNQRRLCKLINGMK